MKKSILLLTLIVAMASFVACNSTEAVEPVASEPASSEVASEEVSSEEVSEEASSEEVAGVFYSAEEIMTLIDTLTAKYTYDDPEFIKSLVIAANLDYITDEDLATLLSTYGYTIEELNAIYNGENGMISTCVAFETSRLIFQGNYIEYDETKDYSKRIRISEAMLNENDKEIAMQFDEVTTTFSVSGFEIEEPKTSGEVTVRSFWYAFTWGQFSVTAYDNYLNQKAN